ncbi:hypothetical protein RDABS01_000165 [Bienertia sinuspersici]
MVDARGRAGGLAMMWSEDLDVTLRKMGERFIDVSIKEVNNLTWRLTGVYGWSEGNQKYKTWNLLQKLGEENSLPWAIMGDFNEVLLECEKKGGNPCDFASIQQFRSVVDQLGMHDLKADGYYYTWSNRRAAEDLIEERLDRVLVNGAFKDAFLHAYVTNLIWDSSDHTPLVIKMGEENQQHANSSSTKLFRFEAKWMQEENFDDTMVGFGREAMEEEGHDWSSVVRNCGQKLEHWDKKTYRLVPRRIKWLKMALLIDTERGCWREDVLREVFLPIDIERIRNVPISARFPEDVMYWKGSNDGVFRVREAYRWAIMEDQAACSNGSDPIWAKIWKLKVPPKVRLFIWKACWDILPHNCNLANKQIRNDRSCARCGAEEDNLHALRDCSWVRRIWENEKASWCKEGATTFREWIACLSGENKYGQLEAFAMVTWSIWNARNDLIFEDHYCSPEACYNKAMDLLQEFQRVNNTALNREKRRTEAKWQPPKDDVIKVNFDAAISTEFDRVGLGIIGRDVEGKVMFAMARTMCNKWESEMGEARAALEAIETARREGCTKIILEGDALVVIQALQQHTMRGGPVQLMVEDSIALCKNFESVSFSFCLRECNQAAHRLAKWAVSSFCDEVWYEGGPTWIHDIVVFESPTFNE